MGEVIAAHPVLGLEMADDRFDRRLATYMPFDVRRHTSARIMGQLKPRPVVRCLPIGQIPSKGDRQPWFRDLFDN